MSSQNQGKLKKRIKPLIDDVQEEPDSIVMNILNDDIGKVLDEAKNSYTKTTDKDKWFREWFGE